MQIVLFDLALDRMSKILMFSIHLTVLLIETGPSLVDVRRPLLQAKKLNFQKITPATRALYNLNGLWDQKVNNSIIVLIFKLLVLKLKNVPANAKTVVSV
jgi:hypothetical protein